MKSNYSRHSREREHLVDPRPGLGHPVQETLIQCICYSVTINMLRQVVLVIVVAVHLCTGTLLPMELFEIAHTHPAAHSKAVSLHDLLLTEGQFPQRNHPVVTFATDSAPSPRRHRKSANGMRRRNRGQHRRGRQLDREAGSVQPKIFYAVGVSRQLLTIQVIS